MNVKILGLRSFLKVILLLGFSGAKPSSSIRIVKLKIPALPTCCSFSRSLPCMLSRHKQPSLLATYKCTFSKLKIENRPFGGARISALKYIESRWEGENRIPSKIKKNCRKVGFSRLKTRHWNMLVRKNRIWSGWTLLRRVLAGKFSLILDHVRYCLNIPFWKLILIDLYKIFKKELNKY